MPSDGRHTNCLGDVKTLGDIALAIRVKTLARPKSPGGHWELRVPVWTRFTKGQIFFVGGSSRCYLGESSGCRLTLAIGRHASRRVDIDSICMLRAHPYLARQLTTDCLHDPTTITIPTCRMNVYLFGRGSGQHVRIKMMTKFPQTLFMV